MKIKLLVEGGAMQPNPALSQKLGPAGINIGQVLSKVNESTKDFKGLKVPVDLDVDLSTKTFEIQIFSPPVSELLKKEFKLEKASGTQKKLQVANASIEQIISIAKQKMANLLAKDMKAAVKSIVGTCTSLGILIENKSPKEIGLEIDKGKYSKEIKAEKTETSAEKRKELDQFFTELHAKQEQLLKQEEEAAKAAAAAKEAAAAATGVPGAAGAAGVAAAPAAEKAKTEQPAKPAEPAKK